MSGLNRTVPLVLASTGFGVFLAVAGTALADDDGAGLNVFQAGDLVSSRLINDNFRYLADCIEDVADSISALAESVDALTTQVDENTDDIEELAANVVPALDVNVITRTYLEVADNNQKDLECPVGQMVISGGCLSDRGDIPLYRSFPDNTIGSSNGLSTWKCAYETPPVGQTHSVVVTAICIDDPSVAP